MLELMARVRALLGETRKATILVPLVHTGGLGSRIRVSQCLALISTSSPGLRCHRCRGRSRGRSNQTDQRNPAPRPPHRANNWRSRGDRPPLILRRVGMPRRIGLVFRKLGIHVVPGLRALHEDVGLGAKRARVVQAADPQAHDVGPRRDTNEQRAAAFRAECARHRVAGGDKELGLAFGDAEPGGRRPHRGGGPATPTIAPLP